MKTIKAVRHSFRGLTLLKRRHNLNSVWLRTKASTANSKIGTPARNRATTHQTYSLQLMNERQYEQEESPEETPLLHNQILHQQASIDRQLYALLEEGMKAADAYEWDAAAKPLDFIISWSEQVDRELMSEQESILFAQALAYRGRMLATGTFEDEQQAKILLQKALRFDPNNQFAQEQLKALAFEEALGKYMASPLKTDDVEPEHTLSLLKQFEQVCQSAHQFQQKLDASLQRGIAAADEYDWYEAVKHLDEVIHVGELKLNRNGKPDFENLTKAERQFFARAHAHRGKLLSIGTFEDEKESKSYFRKALEYDPENALAKEWLTSYEAEEAFGNLRFDSSPSE